MYPFCPPSSTRAQRFLRGLTLLLILITMCLQFEAAHAQAHYARPYTGGGPNNVPSSQGNTISAVYLVDPVSGNPVTPAGTPTGGGSSNPAGLTTSNSIGTTSATILTSGQMPHWFVIQNTSASNVLYIRLDGATVTTTTGYALAAGASLTVPSPLSTAVTAIGSAASTTYTVIGY